MSSTDDRVVQMRFDNKQFMKAAADTSKALADTNAAVDGAGKSKGLLDLSSQMGAVGVAASKMQIITTTALATIANKATNVALSMASALTFDPVRQGFAEYEALLTKQNVIMNATGLSAQAVKGYLTELNKYSDETIYSFGDMTDSIVKFVNAGVDMPTAVVSMRGIANAAAYAGATTQEASRAMYAFSQSMQTGFIMLNDWQQIENANMGTIQFKDTLLEAAVAAGTLTRQGDEYVTSTGRVISATTGWRDGLQDQWATVEVLNSALNKYADTSTKLGKKAFQSATEVRTFTAFMSTLKESLGSGWASIFTSLIGNLSQATAFWTGFSNSVGHSVETFFNFLSVALKTWRQMGGFEKTLQGFKNILAPFAALLGAIGDAWSAAFPSSDSGAGKALYSLSAGFELLTRPLAWLADGIPAIVPLLTVLFTVIGGGVNVVKALVGWLVDLVTQAVELGKIDAPNAGGFLGFLQSVATLAMGAAGAISDLVKKGKGLGDALSGLDLPSLPSFSAPDLGGGGDAAAGAAAGASKSASAFESAASTIQSALVKIGAGFSWLWDQVTGFFSNLDGSTLVKSFNQAIFAVMAYEIIRFAHTMRKGFGGLVDLIPSVVGLIDNVGESLSGFAAAAKREALAKIIISVGIALGILAVSLWVLSRIPADKLLKALGALGVLAFILNKSLGAFGEVIDKLSGKGTIFKTLALSVAMIALATSMLILSGALLIMNKVKWDSIAKGLTTMIVMMKTLEMVGNTGQFAARNLIGAAVAITAVSVAMNIMAGALLLFELVNWESIAKAGVTLGGLALAVGLLALIPYQGIAKVGLALLGASAGIMLMANALILFALVKWEDIGKAAVVLGLLTISLAVLMAVGGPASVAAMLGLAGAMVLLAAACIMFNHVDWESIGKATVVLTVLLAALAVGAVIMTAFLYAIAPVSPVLIILAAGFALLGVGLLAFAAAMTIAMGLAAAGTAAFAALATGAAVSIGVFFQVLAQQAPVIRESVLAILREFIQTVVQAIPMIIKGFKDVWAAIMKELGSGDKKKSFGQLAEEWLDKLIEFARKNIPKVQRLFLDMVISLLKALNARADQFAKLGTEFVVNLIQGIGQRQRAIIDAAIDLVIEMAEGIRKNIKRLTDAGIDLVAGFLHDLADSIRSGSGEIGAGITDLIDAFRDVGVDMIQGLISGASSVDVGGFVSNLASSLPGWAKKVLKIQSPSRVFMEIGKFITLGLTKGIQDHAASAIVAVASMMRGAIATADDYVSKYIQKLDQQAIAAQARAKGLAAAANRATKSAKKTKDKADDRAAAQLRKEAKEAAKDAREENKEAQQAREAARRKERWEKADAAERAQIRANQAQNQLAAAKQAERDAAAARIQANALAEQAKKAGTAEERKRLMKEVERLRKEAREEAQRANELIKNAQKNAGEALVWQKKAGEEAAAAFQEQFDAEAKADADAIAFEKLTDAEKAELRRQQAAELQAKADKHLQKAKELAYTDLQKANELAQQALAEADQAREFLAEAEGYSGGSTNEVISLRQSDAAALAYNDYADLYDAAFAQAAGITEVKFEQNNYSPESLADSEIYRQTNNQLTFAMDKLDQPHKIP